MEFNEKLQELRKQKGLTQESGRGYPNIESLKAIAKFFSVTVDELLSTDEILNIAEEDGKQKEYHRRDLIYGLLDIGASMLLFLPLFAEPNGETVTSVSLIALNAVQPYLKIVFMIFTILTSMLGILTLSMQNCHALIWIKSKTKLSLTLGAMLVMIFIISSQPYAAALTFVLLVIKALMLIKQA